MTYFSGILILPILMLLFAAIPVAIGVYVYRDAKSRNMNSALWTLITVLAPGFIGLIIYLIIRSEQSDLHCPECNRTIRENFAVCPHCGTILKEHCKTCNFPLYPEWVNCPSCGEIIPPEQRVTKMTTVKKDKGLRSILVAVIAIPLALCLIMVIGLVSYSTIGGSSQIFMEQILISELPTTENPELTKWLKNCDTAGKGIYILQAHSRNGDEITTQFLLYRNDGYYTVTPETSNGGWFTNPNVHFICEPVEVDKDRDYTLSYFEYTASRKCKAEVYDSGKKVTFKQEQADTINLNDIDLDANEVCLDINISDTVSTVYSVSWNVYSDNNILFTENESMADGSSMKGQTTNFAYYYPDNINATTISFSLYDADNKVIMESEQFEIGDIYAWNFDIQYNDAGKLTVISNYIN